MSAVAFLVLAATGMDAFPFSRITYDLGVPVTPGAGVMLLAVGVTAAHRGAANSAADRPVRALAVDRTRRLHEDVVPTAISSR